MNEEKKLRIAYDSDYLSVNATQKQAERVFQLVADMAIHDEARYPQEKERDAKDGGARGR